MSKCHLTFFKSLSAFRKGILLHNLLVLNRNRTSSELNMYSAIGAQDKNHSIACIPSQTKVNYFAEMRPVIVSIFISD